MNILARIYTSISDSLLLIVFVVRKGLRSMIEMISTDIKLP